MQHRRLVCCLTAIASGVVAALPFIFEGLFILEFIAFIGVGFVLTAINEEGVKHRSYLYGLLYFWSFGIVLLSWFVELYPLDFAGMTPVEAAGVVALGCLGLSLVQALLFSFSFTVFSFAYKRLGISRHPLLQGVFYAATYVIFDYLNTKTWLGVPWGRLAVSQTGFLPMIQISSVLGSYAVSFIIVFFGFTVGALYYSRAVTNEKCTVKKALPVIVSAALLLSNVIFGCVRMTYLPSTYGDETVTAAAVQGNIPSNVSTKDKELMNDYILEIYASLTKTAGDGGADLVVWPESPFIYSLDGWRGEELREFIAKTSRQNGVVIVTGAFTESADGVSENSSVYFTPQSGLGGVHYVKRHLVPFGEYVPMRAVAEFVFPPLKDIAVLSDDMAQGDDSVVFDTPTGKLGALICFDSIYENIALDSVRNGAEIIVLSTNDSWFGTSAAVYEHNRHAVLRAVECGRYVVRAANTGVSSIIAPTGEVKDDLKPMVEGVVTAEVTPIATLTPYATVGNVFVAVCFAGIVVIGAYSYISKKHAEADA